MFRFTIRELVLVTLVVGMGVGWWQERRRANRLESYNRFVLQAVTRSGYELDGDFVGPKLSKVER